MKGLILAGGKGTRLLPATKYMNKHMVPILNTPMIVYPLNTLKSIGIVDIMVVSGGDHIGQIAEFLGDGSDFGVKLTYKVQREAGGIAQALGLAKDFINGEGVATILGDNIFGSPYLKEFSEDVGKEKALVYLSSQDEPSRFGVAVFDSGELVAVEEKPKIPKSKYVVTGLYIYPPDVFDKILTLKPSNRGELEITDINNMYINEGRCHYFLLDSFWSDAGTPESLKEVIDWAYKKLALDK